MFVIVVTYGSGLRPRVHGPLSEIHEAHALRQRIVRELQSLGMGDVAVHLTTLQGPHSKL